MYFQRVEVAGKVTKNGFSKKTNSAKIYFSYG